MSNKVTAWSFSRYNLYQQCPYKFYLIHIEKRKEPAGPALARGRKIHDDAANFLTDPKADQVPEALESRADLLHGLKQFPGIFVEQKWAFTPQWRTTTYFAKNVWLRNSLDVGVDYGDKSFEAIDWKGLWVHTPIPTPKGFTTMGCLEVGDTVFAMNGRPTKIVGKSEVKNLPCYQIVFCDGHTVICDEEHLWATMKGVKPVTELKKGDAIPVAKPAQMPYKKLAVPPYTLGVWLGDGHRRDGCVSCPDTPVFDRIEEDGYEVLPPQTAKEGKLAPRTVAGLRGDLTRAGVLGKKHIPQDYLLSSVPQRWELVRGLMDTDGTWNRARKQANFSTSCVELATAVRQLLCSLGERPSIHTVKRTGFGKRVTAYEVSWSVNRENPFNLTRKADLVTFRKGPRPHARYVKEVRQITSVETQCIKVDSPTETFLYGNRFAVTHNTGRMYGDSEEQMDLFATTVFARFPAVEHVMTRLSYVDLPPGPDSEKYETHDRANYDKMRRDWERKVEPMFNDTTFAPRQNDKCHLCHFNASNGGPCRYG